MILTSCFPGARGRADLSLARMVTGSVPEVTCKDIYYYQTKFQKGQPHK